RQRIEGAYFVQSWIGVHCHEPQDFDHFRDQEDEFTGKHQCPALPVRNTIAVHKAPYPDDKSDHRKFPEVDQWDGEKLQGAQKSQYQSLRSVLEELKRRRFVFDKSDLYIQEQNAEHAQQTKKEPFVCCEY